MANANYIIQVKCKGVGKRRLVSKGWYETGGRGKSMSDPVRRWSWKGLDCHKRNL